MCVCCVYVSAVFIQLFCPHIPMNAPVCHSDVIRSRHVLWHHVYLMMSQYLPWFLNIGPWMWMLGCHTCNIDRNVLFFPCYMVFILAAWFLFWQLGFNFHRLALICKSCNTLHWFYFPIGMTFSFFYKPINSVILTLLGLWNVKISCLFHIQQFLPMHNLSSVLNKSIPLNH